jgi:hypothetical protein
MNEVMTRQDLDKAKKLSTEQRKAIRAAKGESDSEGDLRAGLH